ncbi:hypothetical protein DOY81_008293 [Sarcophaga bullata]|nr:hypothetical protein DOY81_008293 [Sarcophaga bullata]
MGNTGSTHNLHSESVESELKSYYTQQYLRRTTAESRKKNNQSLLEGWPSGRILSECKVLPQPSENLKLRATMNGAILQAGGTISFRSKEQLEERSGVKNELTNKLQPMRRCHTLILDGQSESLSQHKNNSSLAYFQRTQTLLHVGYNRTKSQENVAAVAKFQDELKSKLTQTSQNTQTITLKVNKYNKKRKAPPAPINAPSDVETNNVCQAISFEPKNSIASKARMYTTNANKASAPQQPQRNRQSPSRTFKNIPFQGGTNVRKSANSYQPDQNTNSSYERNKLSYRREKSFDEVLLRHNIGNEHDKKRLSMPTTNEKITSRGTSITEFVKNVEGITNRNTNDGGREKKLTREHATSSKSASANLLKISLTKDESNLSVRKSHSSDMHLRKGFKIVTENLNSDSKPRFGNESLCAEKKTMLKKSRIPQLKRTFYFGMELHNARDTGSSQNNSEHSPKFTRKNEDLLLENEDINLLSHNIESEEEINDNGILVHVRPTLPRRQLETPSFSPAAAWRNLSEEQQRLQRSKSKQTKSYKNVVESPIYLASCPKINPNSVPNWTPQQDLEEDEDDDDDDDNGISGEEENKLRHKSQTPNISRKMEHISQKHQSMNPLHTFSLSLPRDVHLQCQIKSSINNTEQENNIKSANYWLVPGFNSLKKFKTHLGKNIDSRSQNKCTCSVKEANTRNSYNLQTVFDETIYGDNTAHQSACPLYTPRSNHNDNWVLHKSNLDNPTSTAIKKTTDSNYSKSSSVFLQPKSLKNICGGKHIVYLPGKESISTILDKNSQNNVKHKQMTSKSAHKRQRQRHEIVRESLQDLTPIQNLHQSNGGVSEKNTYRFSFQSTVRVLEKRRLAEKLSKDAEIQEAQRLQELEAMKRVEEDFQRKRAPEKANLRNQLRLHLKASTENEEYRSLPINLNDRYEDQQPSQHQQVSDVNNNIFCRAEPDGAVSPTPDFNDNLEKLTQSSLLPNQPIRRFDSDGDKSECETQTSDKQCYALLIEPYLNTVI